MPGPGTGLADTYHALPTQEIWDYLFIDVIQQASRALVVISCIDEELSSGVVVDEWTNLKVTRQNSNSSCCRGLQRPGLQCNTRRERGGGVAAFMHPVTSTGEALGSLLRKSPTCFPLKDSAALHICVYLLSPA